MSASCMFLVFILKHSATFKLSLREILAKNLFLSVNSPLRSSINSLFPWTYYLISLDEKVSNCTIDVTVFAEFSHLQVWGPFFKVCTTMASHQIRKNN